MIIVNVCIHRFHKLFWYIYEVVYITHEHS
jgi:hypothetical protein